jgi:hypothetical protein
MEILNICKDTRVAENVKCGKRVSPGSGGAVPYLPVASRVNLPRRIPAPDSPRRGGHPPSAKGDQQC